MRVKAWRVSSVCYRVRHVNQGLLAYQFVEHDAVGEGAVVDVGVGGVGEQLHVFLSLAEHAVARGLLQGGGGIRVLVRSDVWLGLG